MPKPRRHGKESGIAADPGGRTYEDTFIPSKC
jgi:hypothetical protein